MNESIRSHRNLIIAVICVIAIVIAVTSMFRTLTGASGKKRINLIDSYGEIVAEEIAQVVPLSSRILVISLDSPRNPTLARQAAILAASLKSIGFDNIAEEAISSEIFGPTIMLEGHNLSAEAFEDALNKHPGVDVVVSMAGTPMSDQHTLRRFNDGSSTLVLAANITTGTNLERWKASDALALAVLPRRHSPPPEEWTKRPETPQDIFNFYYQVLKP